jgi:hypothetical protein
MKRMFTTLSLTIILFTSCSKDEINSEPQLTSGFQTSILNSTYHFTEPIIARSEKKSNGSYDLVIIAERKITIDSSNQIRFVFPDFRKTGATQQTIQLNSMNALSGFVEFLKEPNGLKGVFNYMQSGQLHVTTHHGTYLDGTFDFVYFTFDKYGTKTGEVALTNGSFSNVKITEE